MATTFSFSDVHGKNYTLNVRHNPYSIDWTYNLNTNIVDTYAGQVVQILSVNIDKVTIEGQLGVEGSTGRKREGGLLVPREGTEQFTFNGVAYPGLHAMTEFFRLYFAVSSQGNDPQVSGAYAQVAMNVNYDVDTNPSSRYWPKIIPTDFPSFSRSVENFAPMWRVEAYVLEADRTVQEATDKKALQDLQAGIGYKSANPFSDPSLNNTEIVATTKKLITGFQSLLPDFTQAELRDMIWKDVSIPNFVTPDQKLSTTKTSDGTIK